MTTTAPKPVQDTSSVAAQIPESAQTIDSENLLQGSRQLFILHRGSIYRLLETRNGKLILQK